MKNILVFFVMFALWAGALRGDGFQPSMLDITVDEYVQTRFYENQYSEMDIGVNVSGVPATAWMVVTNLDDGGMIGAGQNGYLGWHYVNGIDTTLYVSESFHLDVGEQTIPWDGRGFDGEYLPVYYTPNQQCGNANPYAYYVWGYAAESERKPVCDFVQVSGSMGGKHVSVVKYDENGGPLANPLLFGNYAQAVTIDGHGDMDNNTYFKWVIGEEPSDASVLMTTAISQEWMSNNSSVCSTGGINFWDHSQFFVGVNDTVAHVSTIEKWSFVTEGKAIRDGDWGGWEDVKIGTSENADGTVNYMELVVGPEYMWAHGIEIGNMPHIFCFNNDGVEQFITDIPDRGISMSDYPDVSADHSLEYVVFGSGQDELLVMSSALCLIQMVNGHFLIEQGGYLEKEDIIIWENGNGDFFLDMNFTDDAVDAWGCISDDPSVSYVKTAADVDANGFSVIWTDYRGLVSFGVLSIDGTGVGYGAYADEVIPEEGGSRWGGQLIDTGSNFDGMYVVNTTPKNGIWGTSFVGFDSDMGRIQYNIYSGTPSVVAEDAPQPVILNQNTPNPFNPSTSISFTLPEAGHVNLTVYNIAGQLVAVLQNGEMSAGEHAVAWHADGFPAGVYFYTLASGGFSRTKKMTLVK